MKFDCFQIDYGPAPTRKVLCESSFTNPVERYDVTGVQCKWNSKMDPFEFEIRKILD